MKKMDLIRGILIMNAPVIILLVCFNLIFLVIKLPFSKFFLIVSSILFIILASLFYAFVLKQFNYIIHVIFQQLKNLNKGIYNDSQKLRNTLFFRASEIQNQVDFLLQTRINTINRIQDIVGGSLNIDKDDAIDEISQKLLVLQQKLAEDKAVLEQTKIEEEQRNWMAGGLAKFSEILRQDSSNIADMGYSIISNLVDYVQMNQGGLFVFNDETETENYYELVAAVAYERRRLINKRINFGEGLIGRCAFEKKTIYMTDIPSDYVSITSGLGTANPNYLLIVPCIMEDQVYGVIELTSFNKIEDYQLDFIEKLGESIASSIYAVRNNERTSALLKASQSQANELAAHEEELRQNLEEMEAIQEDLKRQMKANAEMQKKLKFEKYLFDTLLNNIPARINFKDKDRKYLRASKSFLDRFGKTNNDQIIGKTDVDFFGAEFAKKTMADELEIIQNREPRINFVEHEVKDNGVEIWKNVSKIPLFDEDGSCIGLFASVYDITDFKLVELENKKLKEELVKQS